MRVAQIKLPLDPAPRLIFQLATMIAIVDRLSLRLNQLKLNLVVKVCELPATAVAVTSVLDMFQAVTVMRRGSGRTVSSESWRPLANWSSRSIAASIARRRAATPSSPSAWRSRRPAWARPSGADHRGQHQPLSHQDHQYDGEGRSRLGLAAETARRCPS